MSSKLASSAKPNAHDRIIDTQGDDYANPRLEVRGLRLEV